MSLTHDQFVADVAAVYTGGPTDGVFGSGRLIAPGVILTAGHVVDYPTREAPTRAGWKAKNLQGGGVCEPQMCELHPSQAGVDIVATTLWLGHESMQTAHG